MKIKAHLLTAGLALLLSATANAQTDTIVFTTDFDEADLVSTGLTIDTPNIDLTTIDSGTVTLDTTNQTLNLAANGANLWGDREGAPIAWVAAPTVAVGETWFAETRITHEDNSIIGNTEFDQAGITFYSGTAGLNPGSENGGLLNDPPLQSLFLGISDWNAWDHRVQGFADNNPSEAIAATAGDDTFDYRVEVTEDVSSAFYNFFYREEPTDSWTQIGTPDLEQDFDNTAVGLFMKGHNNNTTATTAFDYFTTGTITGGGGGGGDLMCDLDSDGDCDLDDIDLLYQTASPDISAWLSQAEDTDNPWKTDAVRNPDGASTDLYTIGDANLDGDVNSTDLGLLLNNFNNSDGLPPVGVGWGGGDLDADGIVNSVDLGLLLNNFNFTSAASVSAVPEPGTLSLLALSMLGLLGLRRRR